MRGFPGWVWVVWMACFGLPGKSAAGQGLEMRMAQLQWRNASLQFDLELRAVGTAPQYLGFIDYAVAFEPGLLHDTARIYWLPESAQLLNSEGDLLKFYAPNLLYRIEMRDSLDLLFISIDPPRFKNLAEFLSFIARVDSVPGKYRMGRFMVTGVQNLPDQLHPLVGDKGTRCQAFNFLPQQDFNAEAVQLHLPAADLTSQWLEGFEIRKNGQEVQLSWVPGEMFGWARAFVERSYDGQQWEEVAFVPGSRNAYTDRPQPPPLLEGRPLVYYRLLVQDEANRAFYSPLRMTEF